MLNLPRPRPLDLHLNLIVIIPQRHKPRILPLQGARISASAEPGGGHAAAFWVMMVMVEERRVGHLLRWISRGGGGGEGSEEVFEEGFEGEGAAADEARVDFEDPVCICEKV